MRRQPSDRPENVLALAVAEIERIKALLSRITDGYELVVSTGTAEGDTALPVEAGAHTLYGVKHTRALRVTDGGVLDVDYEQGQIWVGGIFYSIGAGSLTLANNDTSYVFVDNAGTVADNVTGFPADCAPLALVVAAAGDIVSITDRRSYLAAGVHVARGTLPAYTVTNSVVDRTFDADATTINELADILATLINDVATMHA